MHGNATVRNIYPGESRKETTKVKAEVCKYSNLLLAEERCHRNVGYKNSVSRYHMHLLSKVYELRESLMNETYHTQKGAELEVFEPKYRIVTTTKYKDRIPQASFVVNYMYKEVIPKLIQNNFACIKSRGVDNARDTFKEILRNSNPDDYCLCADLKSYFDSIRHDVLFDEMKKYISDEWAMRYYLDVINSNKKSIGIGLGSEINQLSAVTLLNCLDWVLDDGKYVRYMDDFRYIGTKDECEKALEIIRSECDRLHLKISANKTYIQPVQNPIKFLGFTFWKHENGKITMKRMKDKLNNEKRKLRRMKKSKVPFREIMKHYECVRAVMKKGNRSGVVKLDKYFNNLFEKELDGYANKKK